MMKEFTIIRRDFYKYSNRHNFMKYSLTIMMTMGHTMMMKNILILMF